VVAFRGARDAKSIRNAFGTIPLLQNANLMELKHILAGSAAPASLIPLVNKISIDTWKLGGRGANAEQLFNGARPPSIPRRRAQSECIGSARKKVHTRLRPQNQPRERTQRPGLCLTRFFIQLLASCRRIYAPDLFTKKRAAHSVILIFD
jgi:hypothetical protein